MSPLDDYAAARQAEKKSLTILTDDDDDNFVTVTYDINTGPLMKNAQ